MNRQHAIAARLSRPLAFAMEAMGYILTMASLLAVGFSQASAGVGAILAGAVLFGAFWGRLYDRAFTPPSGLPKIDRQVLSLAYVMGLELALAFIIGLLVATRFGMTDAFLRNGGLILLVSGTALVWRWFWDARRPRDPTSTSLGASF